MEYVIIFIVGVLIGAGVAFFVLRNNPGLEEKIRDKIEREYEAKLKEAQSELAKLKEKLGVK